MIRTIYLDAKLDKQMQALRRAGRKAALAAAQAQDIVQKLQAGGPALVEPGAITKHGEQRIKGCVKYDLGSGYRLLTFKRGMDLFVLYIGSHDDSHRWIENNRELPVDQIRKRCRVIPVENDQEDVRCSEMEKRRLGGEESGGLSESQVEALDDHQLRSIFSGLIESVQNTTNLS